MSIQRSLQKQIESRLFHGKIIILYGARQVGKTTLVKTIVEQYKSDSLYLNCDEPDIRQSLTDKTSTELHSVIGKHKLVIIDEAQRVPNIGLTLKLLADTLTNNQQIIATGSSAFELSNRVSEPLTGRAEEFHLFPFSATELINATSQREFTRLLKQRMIFGMYPEIVQQPTDAETLLRNLAGNYLFKDVLEYHHIKKPDVLEKILQALALQIGQEVSYTELARTVGAQKETVEHYVRLLEQAFIIVRVRPFHKNLRTELRKLRKIYFVDLGIRNAVINNLNPLSLRQDVGALWENFLVIERIKRNHYTQAGVAHYFWRTHAGQEIDFVEQRADVLSAFEFKWSKKKDIRPPREWTRQYPRSSFDVISPENFTDFVMYSSCPWRANSESIS